MTLIMTHKSCRMTDNAPRHLKACQQMLIYQNWL